MAIEEHADVLPEDLLGVLFCEFEGEGKDGSRIDGVISDIEVLEVEAGAARAPWIPFVGDALVLEGGYETCGFGERVKVLLRVLAFEDVSFEAEKPNFCQNVLYPGGVDAEI